MVRAMDGGWLQSSESESERADRRPPDDRLRFRPASSSSDPLPRVSQSFSISTSSSSSSSSLMKSMSSFVLRSRGPPEDLPPVDSRLLLRTGSECLAARIRFSSISELSARRVDQNERTARPRAVRTFIAFAFLQHLCRQTIGPPHFLLSLILFDAVLLLLHLMEGKDE